MQPKKQLFFEVAKPSFSSTVVILVEMHFSLNEMGQ